ncbi:MAG: 4-(cytidine 5'-diphospho)-2-C-methyl-D-erythritol kinase, partial [Xenophilus sp.]
ALQAAAGPRAAGLGAHIGVHKRIPVQAGLGGGSSDAATCLLALNRLWALGFSTARLARIGLALGADIPFFLGGRNAWAEGVGELLTPVALPAARFAVLKPPQGLDTALIFSAPDLQRATPPAILSGFAANDAEQIYRSGRNDLQPVAERLCPQVREGLNWLAAQGLSSDSARMTGSGSAVFAQMPQGMQLADPPPGWRLRQCGNLAIHPLAGWAR